MATKPPQPAALDLGGLDVWQILDFVAMIIDALRRMRPPATPAHAPDAACRPFDPPEALRPIVEALIRMLLESLLKR